MANDYFSSHISEKFNEELSQLTEQLEKMGKAVMTQFDLALQSIEEKDPKLAKKTLKKEKIIHNYDIQIYELGYQIMALRSPVAGDLRAIMSILQTTSDLERISDELGKIAKAIKDKNEIPEDIIHIFLDYGNGVCDYLNRTLKALNSYDVQASTTIIRKKKSMNALYLESIQKLMALNKTVDIDSMSSYLFIAKGLETIAVNARNIAKYIIFFEEGIDVRHQARKDIIEQFSQTS
jgi:phosphate transport system protein